MGIKFSKTQLKNQKTQEGGFFVCVFFLPIFEVLAALGARALPLVVKGALTAGAAKGVEKIAGQGVSIIGIKTNKVTTTFCRYY